MFGDFQREAESRSICLRDYKCSSATKDDFQEFLFNIGVLTVLSMVLGMVFWLCRDVAIIG